MRFAPGRPVRFNFVGKRSLHTWFAAIPTPNQECKIGRRPVFNLQFSRSSAIPCVLVRTIAEGQNCPVGPDIDPAGLFGAAARIRRDVDVPAVIPKARSIYADMPPTMAISLRARDLSGFHFRQCWHHDCSWRRLRNNYRSRRRRYDYGAGGRRWHDGARRIRTFITRSVV